MNIPLVFDFLKELAANNNREWFNAHKADYEKAHAEFEKLVGGAINRLSLFDESIRGVQVKDCLYRIYRDIRFSPDKTPYKIHFGAYINAKGKNSEHCGYYLHLQPDSCLIAGGTYQPPSKMLKAIRQAVYDNMEEYRSIVEDPKFKRFFPQVGYEFLKIAPKGFPKDYEFINYLKCKEYACDYNVPDQFYCTPDVFDRIEAACRELKRFNDFLNYTIDDFEE
jgi:uncharacterized protein (TIGR02453 family)